MYKNNNIGMKTKIQKNKRCGMRKLVKNKEVLKFSQSWYIQNNASMNELYDICLRTHSKTNKKFNFKSLYMRRK